MIERRIVLAGLAAAATTQAFAQGQTGRPQGQATRTPAGSAIGPEMQWMQQTLMVGSLSLALSRLAEQKARFARLKQFANFEVNEQQTMANVLKEMQNPSSPSGTITPPTEAEVQQHLDQMGRQTLQMLQSAQAGETFDRDYLMNQIEGHQKLLHIQEEYLPTGRNPEAVIVAKLASTMIREHLQLLANINMEMSAATTGAAPRR
jgi:putative membrane protein